jgi:hypothetical protein
MSEHSDALRELESALEMADIAYSIDYSDDVFLRRTDEKLDAVIRYLIATATPHAGGTDA